ncbi:ABC1 kinase family protein [Neptuniibacter sp. QD72_48]|uniref:ABC1 kinase family protein n=1 Tax=Neptuniibacter sp. QD72_48 TaxID=3398214 RepID=UPI0039F61BC4
MDELFDQNTKAVPTSRISRLSKLGVLASKVAGNMLVDGGKELMQGKSPAIRDLLISEKNLKQLADKLATMRGAAMKAGQLLSMDAGSLVPPDMAVLLERLRADAVTMPAVQLLDVLEKNWGDEWQDQFQRFSFKPIAAASIGQVHKGLTLDHRELAIKIQYPGVRESIDSDLDNVFGLLRFSGLIPKDLDLTPLVDEARRQLKLEADYRHEGQQLRNYAANMATFSRREELMFPAYHEDLSTDQILCMSYMQGQSIDKLAYASQEERNRVMSLMMELFFAEFLDYRCVQTDPNLANFLYNLESKQLVLLDFGATREFDWTFVDNYQEALRAATFEDRNALASALDKLGFFVQGKEVKNLDVVLDIFVLATEPLRFKGSYDFSGSQLAEKIRDKGLSMSSDPDAWHSPPPDILFLHRKMAGLYLMATRFNASIDMNRLVSRYW